MIPPSAVVPRSDAAGGASRSTPQTTLTATRAGPSFETQCFALLLKTREWHSGHASHPLWNRAE